MPKGDGRGGNGAHERTLAQDASFVAEREQRESKARDRCRPFARCAVCDVCAARRRHLVRNEDE